MSVNLEIQVTPKASRNEIVAFTDGVLRVRIAASPVEGKANKALIRLLSRKLKVRAGDIQILRGERSRKKLVQIDGVDAKDVQIGLSN